MKTDGYDELLRKAANIEVAQMRAAIAPLPANGGVTLTRDQFAKLAELIERLAARRGCGDTECFHAPVDGFRWWVPLPEVERERAELRKLLAHAQAKESAPDRLAS